MVKEALRCSIRSFQRACRFLSFLNYGILYPSLPPSVFMRCVMSSSFNHRERIVVFLCWAAYTAAYAGRFSYTASILSMQNALGLDKASLGAVGSSFFIAYACGQLVLGVLTRHASPRAVMAVALLASALCNLLVPRFPTPKALAALWFVNGIVQSSLWCNLLRDISHHLREEVLGRTIVITSTTLTFGTFVAYGTAACFARFALWQSAFWVGAACEAAAAFALLAFHPRGNGVRTEPPISSPQPDPGRPRRTWPVGFLVVFCFMGLLLGLLRDGVGTWIPSILHEGFGIEPSKAVLATLGVSLVGILGAAINQGLRHRLRLLATMNALYFGFAALFLGGTLLFLVRHMLPGMLFCFAALTLLATMIMNVLTNMFGLYYRSHFDAGTATALVNTCCYVGTSLAAWGAGALADRQGWSSVFLALCAVSVAGTLLSVLGRPTERGVREVSQ